MALLRSIKERKIHVIYHINYVDFLTFFGYTFIKIGLKKKKQRHTRNILAGYKKLVANHH